MDSLHPLRSVQNTMAMCGQQYRVLEMTGLFRVRCYRAKNSAFCVDVCTFLTTHVPLLILLFLENGGPLVKRCLRVFGEKKAGSFWKRH